jgi:hypothetical protein
VLPVDKREQVEFAQLRGTLEDGTQCRARRLFNVMEEHDRALWHGHQHERLVTRSADAPAVTTAAVFPPAATLATAAPPSPTCMSWCGRQQQDEDGTANLGADFSRAAFANLHERVRPPAASSKNGAHFLF